MKWLICTAMLIVSTSSNNTTSQPVDDIELGSINAKPNQQLVMHELQRLGIKHTYIVLAQSILETGHYRSKLTRSHNNLFGFRTNKGYLKFDSWQESCAYYKQWQDKHYKPNKYNNYYHFLRAIGYAGNPNYTTIVKKIANGLSKSKNK